MRILVLNSGSNGNAIYVESSQGGGALLLDCGLSRRETERRLRLRGRSLARVGAVVVTHEHRDHIAGLAQIAKHHPAPIYATPGTIPALTRRCAVPTLRSILPDSPIAVEDLAVTLHPKSHDAADPVFVHVARGDRSFVYATDLGTPSARLAALIERSDALLLESNYDVEMLWAGSYPQDIKARIHSDHGHLSNAQAMHLLEKHGNGSLRALILGHISENNNTHEIVRREVEALRERKKDFRPSVHLASRHEVGEFIHL